MEVEGSDIKLQFEGGQLFFQFEVVDGDFYVFSDRHYLYATIQHPLSYDVLLVDFRLNCRHSEIIVVPEEIGDVEDLILIQLGLSN